MANKLSEACKYAQTPYAYSVEWFKNGQTQKSLFLERPRAEEYAMKMHGVVIPLFK
jgi:hypothetical protein